MRIVKKIIAAFLAMITLGIAMWTPTLEAVAADNVVSGKCGMCGRINYTLNTATRKMTISGEGDMCKRCDDSWKSYRDKIQTVEIKKGVTSIGGYAFWGCDGLKSITIPEGVTSIGDEAFYDCSSLTSITIPEGVTSIGYCAFEHCRNLTSITLPKSIEFIREDAFYDCTRLKDVYYIGVEADWKKMTIKSGNDYLTRANIHYCQHKKTGWSNVVLATFGNDGQTGEGFCPICNNIVENKLVYRLSSVSLSDTKFTYNGKTQRPSLTVKDRNGKTLRLNTDYVVQYSGNGKNVGKYNVKVTFKGNYTGSKTLTYTINPKNTKLNSVAKGSKSFTAKWTKQTKEVTGYQIRYSLKKNMSGSKTITINKTKTTSCTVKKLKGNKKYYVQIRTYKKTGGKNYYSSWSSAKSVTTKK